MPQNKFKSKTPVSDTPNGISVSDILAFAAGKKSGANLTTSDINTVISKAGIAGRDAKAIRKAASKFIDSESDYRLQGDGNYNVYGKEGQVTTAGRSTGNKVGLNAGDIVGLGNNMGKLVGLAKMFSSAFDENKTPKSSANQTPATEIPAIKTETTTQQSLNKSGSKKSMLSKEAINPKDLIGASSNFESKLKAYHDKYNSNSQVSDKTGKKPRTTPGLPAEGNMIWGDLMRAFDPKTYQRLGIAYNPTQFWDESARERARTMGKEDAEETESIRNDYKKIQKESTLMEKLFTPNPDIISSPLPNMGIFTPNPAKIASPLQWLKGRMASKINIPKIQGPTKQLTGKKLLQIPQNATPSPAKQVTTFGEKVKPRYKIKGDKVEKMAEGGKIKRANLLGDDYWENFNSNIRNKKFSVPNNQTIDIPGNTTGNYEAKQPGIGIELSGLPGDGAALDVAGKVAKYALPFIGTHLANRELSKVKSVNFKPAQLMAGVVSDVPRPNFGLRYRVPTGNDVQSEVAGQKFADAQQKEMEANYNVANAQSRIAQGQQVVNNLNRNEMYNNQGENNARLFNANQIMNLASARAQNVQEPFIAAQHHLATDISTDAYLKTSKDTESAEAILKSAPYGSKEWIKAAERLGYNTTTGIPKGRKGMKLKAAC